MAKKLKEKTKTKIKQKISKKNSRQNYENDIMFYICNNPQGSTIADIMKGIDASRNTVSKYIMSLEGKNKVENKKIGAYNFYFPYERRFLPQDRMIGYYKELLSGMKRYAPDYKEIAKKIGKESGKYFDITLTQEANFGNSNKEIMKLFEIAYPGLDPFQEMTKTKIIENNDNYTRCVFRLSKSSFIDDIDDCAGHYYAVCGFAETFLFREFGKKFKCDILVVNHSENKDESYVDILLEIIEE